jgi:hypothetical protein
MATQPTNSSPSPSTGSTVPTGLDAWVPYLEQIGYGALAVGIGLAVLCLVIGYRDSWAHPPLLTWGLATSLVFIGAGLYCAIPDLNNNLSRGEALRAAILFVLSVGGFVSAVAGLLLPFVQYREYLGGDLKSWREHGDILALCIGAFVGGMVLMFLGLSLGRSYERTIPALRRLLYGYNAVFSTLLLIVILGIVNILAYSPVWPFSLLNGQPIDWTTGHIYSLKDDSKKILGMLKEPTKVYLIMSTRSMAYEESVGLVKNSREVRPDLFSWETLSPQISDDKIKQLQEKYQLEKTPGMLVVVGVEPETRHRFIPVTELMKPYTDRMGMEVADEGGNPKLYFTGEIALMKTLQQLAFNTKPIVVYFTQGNGELDFNGNRRRDLSLRELISSLDRSTFTLKPLPYDQAAAAAGIPADADIVVVAGPREPLSPAAIQGLRDYADKRTGKLLVLLGATAPDPKGNMRSTGLEAMLRDYQVDVGDSWVFYAVPPILMTSEGRLPFTPETLHVRVKPDSTSKIAGVFRDEDRMFVFPFARPVGKLNEAAPPPGGSVNTVDELVETIPRYRPWLQKQWTGDIGRIASALETNDSLFQQLGATKPVSLAVTVANGDKPRMVVVGNTTWVSDVMAELGPLRDNNLQLFRAFLSWLVDRPDLVVAIDDKPPTYALTIPEDRVIQLYLLPGFLMILGVLTLGGGVWIVRRR